MMSTPDELIARRTALNITRKDAATLSSLKESAIRAIETGKIPRGREDLTDQYTTWLEDAEVRQSKSASEAIPCLVFNAKAHGADPVLDDDGVEIRGMWLMPDRGLGRRYVIQEPTVGECAGWTPGRKFRVDGEPGTFMFQRLMVHAVSGAAHVDAFGGTSSQTMFRSFRLDRIVGG